MLEYDRSSLGRLVDHLDAILQEIHGKLVRGHVEVSRIKARARTEVELGRDVLADLLVHLEVQGQLRVVLLDDDPGGPLHGLGTDATHGWKFFDNLRIPNSRFALVLHQICFFI